MLSFSPQLLPFPLHPKKQSPKPAWSYWELSDVCASIREPFLGVEGGEGASSSKSPNEQGLGPPPILWINLATLSPWQWGGDDRHL